jgi:hypothetical protein
MGQGIIRIDLDGTPRRGERRRKDDRRVRAATNRRKLASEGQFGPGAGKTRIGRDRPLEQFDRILVGFLSEQMMLVLAGKKEFVSREIFRARTPRGCLVGFEDHAAPPRRLPS